MGIDRLKRVLLCLGAALWLALAAPAALAAAPAPKGQALLPGQESWQPYLDGSPARLEDFASDPLGALRALLPGDLAGTMRASVAGYAQVLLFCAGRRWQRWPRPSATGWKTGGCFCWGSCRSTRGC